MLPRQRAGGAEAWEVGCAELRLGTYKKRTVIGLSLAKPRAWWKFWPAPEEDE